MTSDPYIALNFTVPRAFCLASDWPTRGEAVQRGRGQRSHFILLIISASQVQRRALYSVFSFSPHNANDGAVRDYVVQNRPGVS